MNWKSPDRIAVGICSGKMQFQAAAIGNAAHAANCVVLGGIQPVNLHDGQARQIQVAEDGQCAPGSGPARACPAASMLTLPPMSPLPARSPCTDTGASSVPPASVTDPPGKTTTRLAVTTPPSAMVSRPVPPASSGARGSRRRRSSRPPVCRPHPISPPSRVPGASHARHRHLAF